MILASSSLRLNTQEEFDILVIPGGAKGAETLSQNEKVQKLVRLYVNRQKVVGMICAGEEAFPTVIVPSLFIEIPINIIQGALLLLQVIFQRSDSLRTQV